MADAPAAWPAPLTVAQIKALRLLVRHGRALTTNQTVAPRADWRVAWIDGRSATALARRRLAERDTSGWVPTEAGIRWLEEHSDG